MRLVPFRCVALAAGQGRPTCVLASLLLMLLAACGGGSEDEPIGPGPAIGSLAPDFLLTDVNPNSPLYTTQVTPRQRLGKVSAWYFGHAT